MGQKVNPISFRLGTRKHWQSSWFSEKDYAKLVFEDAEIRRVVMDKLPKATVGRVEIARNNQDIVVNIYTPKPGIVIGRSGEGSNKLKTEIQKIIHKAVKINIFEIPNPESDAMIVAQTVALQIEKRIAYKRALKQAISKATDRGVKGIKIRVSGRLNGAEIARSEHYAFGSIPLHTIKADVDFAKTIAFTKYGTIGIKVWVFKGIKSINN